MRLHIDFEVYSAKNIKEVPFDVYASDPSTKIILTAWAIDEEPVQVWESDKGPSPDRLRQAMRNTDSTVVAWNINYERTVLKFKSLDIPLERWLDPMVLARYAGLPGRLKDCAAIPMIGVPAEEKTKSETLLIRKFCLPNKEGRRTLPDEAPEDWKLFVDYCRKDVQTMRHVLNWLEPRFPFPDRERRLWLLDQKINERGLPADVEMAKAASGAVVREGVSALEQMKQITGLENPNSIMQLHPWLAERGYKYDSLGKDFLETALSCNDLTPEARNVINLRLATNKASVKKFNVIVNRTSPDGRLKNQFVYYGAHTGRWSSRDLQAHNMTRKKTDQQTLTTLVETADYARAND